MSDGESIAGREREVTFHTPGALSREQVEKLCWDIRNCDVLGNEIDDMIAHDAALRATITQQAQELEGHAVRIDALRTHLSATITERDVAQENMEANGALYRKLFEEHLDAKQQLAAMTTERDNYLSKWRASADLNKGLLRDCDASQARCRELENRGVVMSESTVESLTRARKRIRPFECETRLVGEYLFKHDVVTIVSELYSTIAQLQATLAAREETIERLKGKWAERRANLIEYYEGEITRIKEST